MKDKHLVMIFSVFGGNSGLNTPTTPFAEECESDVVRSQTNLMEEDKAGIWIVCGKYLKRGTKPSQRIMLPMLYFTLC